MAHGLCLTCFHKYCLAPLSFSSAPPHSPLLLLILLRLLLKIASLLHFSTTPRRTRVRDKAGSEGRHAAELQRIPKFLDFVYRLLS